MAMFENFKYLDTKSKIKVFIFAVVAFFVAIFLEYSQVSIECTSKDNYCTVIRTNVFKISSYERLYTPNEIEGFRCESYQHGKHRHTSYRLKFFSKNEDVRAIEHLGNYEETTSVGNNIMSCIKSENYPCRVDARGY